MMTKVASNIIRRYQMNMLYKLAGGVGPAVGAAVRSARPTPATQPPQSTDRRLQAKLLGAATGQLLQQREQQQRNIEEYEKKHGPLQKPRGIGVGAGYLLQRKPQVNQR